MHRKRGIVLQATVKGFDGSNELRGSILVMSEKFPYREPAPDAFETRRDALLARIVFLREAIKNTPLNLEIVTAELTKLNDSIQQAQSTQGMEIYEEVVDRLEKIVSPKK